jgi:hypothetical protein
MKWFSMNLTWRVASVAALLFFSTDSMAQECNRRALVISAADLYSDPPRYVTGIGWQGNRIGQLPPGTQILVCREASVPFGFSQKTWLQVAYFVGNRPNYGWILAETVRNFTSRQGEDALAGGFSVVSDAHAAEAPGSEGNIKWDIPSQVPAPAPSEGKTIEGFSEGAPTPASWGDLCTLYAPFFLAVVLGMVAKALVDYLDDWNKEVVRMHMRNAITAILVSPIVFLGFLNAGNFQSSRQTFIVLWLLAFQNGFFWQTVLKKDAAPRLTPNPPEDKATKRRGQT